MVSSEDDPRLRQSFRTRVRPKSMSGVAASYWKAHGLSPHRWRQFKLSKDRAFAEKLHDVVGLYVSPPAHAVVLSVDEKSQIQALDRPQPGLPLKKGRGPTMTHDYKRNAATTPFAALKVLDGSVIGQNMQRHRHQEFIRFLNRIERDVPEGKANRVILDNYCTHKHAKVRAWLARHPRWTFHFIPTSSSWLNAVERFSPNPRGAGSSTAYSIRSWTCRPPSTASSPNITPPKLKRSSGAPIQTTSAASETEGSKCWIQSTSYLSKSPRDPRYQHMSSDVSRCKKRLAAQ